MGQKIKDLTKSLMEQIASIITSDMDKSQIDEYQHMISQLEEINAEDDLRNQELIECKEVIIKQVKQQGSSKEPSSTDKKDETEIATSWEDIANEVVNGGK